jgi:putative redox protein
MIRADSQPARFKVRFTNGSVMSASDATTDKGGANDGFRPHELLEAALASCMNMTLRMAAERHAIPLVRASTTVTLDRGRPDKPVFKYAIELVGDLSETQKQALLSALTTCPVRKTLSQPLHFALSDQP